jgi:hypothetical protein
MRTYRGHCYRITKKNTFEYEISIDYRPTIRVCTTEQGAQEYVENRIDAMVDRAPQRKKFLSIF